MLLHSSLAKKIQSDEVTVVKSKGGKQRIIYLELDCLVALWSEVHYPERIGQLGRASYRVLDPTPNKFQKIFIISYASRFLKNENFCIIKCSRFYTMK